MLNEEPYALIAHVRFRGGAWGVIPVSTREKSEYPSKTLHLEANNVQASPESNQSLG